MLILVETPPHAQWAAALLACLTPEPQPAQEAPLVQRAGAPPPPPALPDLARALLREHGAGESADDARNLATVGMDI